MMWCDAHLDGKTILYNCPLPPREKKINLTTFHPLQVLNAHSCTLWFIWRVRSFKSKTNWSLQHDWTLPFGQVYPVEKQNTALWLGRLAHWRLAHSQISLSGRGQTTHIDNMGSVWKPPSLFGFGRQSWSRSGKGQATPPAGPASGPFQPNAS